MSPNAAIALPEELLDELRHVIDNTRRFIAATINSALTIAFWKIGDRIRKEALHEALAGSVRKLLLHCHDN